MIKMIKIGFTGTQEGMTQAQKISLLSIFQEKINSISEFRHGDCIGADAEAHKIFDESRKVYKTNAKIIIHPPKIETKRAFCKADEIVEPYDYLYRNKMIVNGSDLIIATPKSMNEELRSGTWSTVRYAIFRGKNVIIIFPNGEVK